jgi:conjugative transfer pilus assembly protein TraH
MFRKNKLRKKALALGVASGLWTVPRISTATGLNSDMDALFNEMSNVTQPGIFETQRRGVLAGGRYTTKTRIFNENLVAFTPPSWKAGCGGVDLFGGSLSFVNAEQIVTLLRSVAANAKGYAFQLALDNVFPDGAKWIENFQKKIQQLNQYLGNSCQLAQGIVNDATSSFDVKHKTDASITATTTGLFDDVFSSKQEQGGSTPLEQLKSNNPDEYKKMIGNIIWKQLKKNNANAWFTYGDNTLLEAIMSVTGTVIIGDIVNDSHASITEKTTPITTLPGNKIQISDLITGSNVEIYSCGSDTENCLSAGATGGGVKTVNITGIKSQIEDMLIGSSTSTGIIFKFASNAGTLSTSEQNFLASLPVGIGAIIRNLSVLSKDSAMLFASESSGAISLAMMYSFTNELFRAAFIAISNSDSPYKQQALEVLRESQANMRAEYSILTAQYGDLSSQIEKYNNLLNNVRKQKYMLSTLTKAPRTKE